MAAKTKQNLFYKLRLRETKGNFQSVTQRTRLFKRCPGRFCVPLRSLVAEEKLLRGHVFLGFTKCGQYMLSYQLSVLPQDSFPMLLFHYTLHWWQFCLRKPLKLIHSVPLFVGEEVDSDLHLIISQSMDESKVVVCGICHGNNEEASHMCYITVCAAPPRTPCPKCKSCVKISSSFREKNSGYCLEHSFAVHFKYNLLPPFPVFNPSVYLQMDRIMLFNTSDSLLALEVITSSSEEERRFCGNLFSRNSESPSYSNSYFDSQSIPSLLKDVEQACHRDVDSACVSNLNVVRHVSDVMSTDSQVIGDVIRENMEELEVDAQKTKSNTCVSHEFNDSASISSTANVVESQVTDNVIGKEFEDCDQGAHHKVKDTCISAVSNDDGNLSGLPYDGNLSGVPNNDGNLPWDIPEDLNVFSATAVSGLKPDNHKHQRELFNSHSYSLEQKDYNISNCQNPCRYDHLPKEEQQDQSINDPKNKKLQEFENDICFKSGSEEKEDLRRNSKNEYESEDPLDNTSSVSIENENEEVKLGSISDDAFGEESGIENDKKVLNEKQDSPFGGSATSLEEDDSLLTTCCLKVFSRDLVTHDSMEDSSSLYELETILPVTVTSPPALEPLSCVSTHNTQRSYTAFENDLSRYKSPFVISQVSLDLERCICKLIDNHETLRAQYKSLRDYDTEIITACPHSADVIVLMKILVYVTKQETTIKYGLPVSTSPSLKSTGFVFSWNIQTGQVKTLHNMELHDFSLKKHNFKFDLAATEASELWRKVVVPRSARTRVQAFSNHTVFGGKSLKYLKHPNLPFAVVLH